MLSVQYFAGVGNLRSEANWQCIVFDPFYTVSYGNCFSVFPPRYTVANPTSLKNITSDCLTFGFVMLKSFARGTKFTSTIKIQTIRLLDYITISCTPDKDIRVSPVSTNLISPMLSHPGPDKNHVYLMHLLYRKSRIYIVK